MKTTQVRTVWDLPFEALRKIKALERKHITYAVQTQSGKYVCDEQRGWHYEFKDTWHPKGYYQSNLYRLFVRVFYEGEISVFLIRAKNNYNGKMPTFNELEIARLSNDGTLYYNRQLWRNMYNQWVVYDKSKEEKERAKYLEPFERSQGNVYCDAEIVCGADNSDEFLRTSGLAPYFYNPRKTHIWNYHNFVKAYRENLPTSELLCKAGYLDLAMDGKVCSAPKEQKKRFIAYLKRYGDELRNKERPLTYHVLDRLSKADMPYSKYLKQNAERRKKAQVTKSINETIPASERVKKKIAALIKDKWLNEYLEYVERNGRYNYRDYLASALELGWDWREKGVLMPFHFQEAHDQATSMTRAKRDEAERKANEKRETNIAQFAELLGDATIDSITFKPMKSTADFVSTGDTLHNCVGRCGYNTKMAEGISFCVRLYLNDELSYCAEIDGKAKRILQLYAKNNTKDERYKNFEEATLKYMKLQERKLQKEAERKSL